MLEIYENFHHTKITRYTVFQACDRYRMSRYSLHISDTQYAYVPYSLSLLYTLDCTNER